MATAAEQAWLDQEDQHVAVTIRKHGCFIQYVFGCGCGERSEPPPFAYSVGFFGLGHPELLIFTVDPGTAAAVINDLFAPGTGKRQPRPRPTAAFRRLAAPGHHREGAGSWRYRVRRHRHYQRPNDVSVPVLELTWSDKNGRFLDAG